MAEVFKGAFTQQEPICEASIAAALRVLRHGRLTRYNTVPGEIAETALLEEEFAAAMGAKYCLAVASGGYALAAALRALEVRPGDVVLTNAFTLAPVPGAIAALGAEPRFIEVSEDLTIDLDDLEAVIDDAGAKVLLLSHMRGHICDMERLMAICTRAGVRVVEDCAHTMGAAWNGTPSGRFGVAGCYSTQTYKHLNSGEGGLIVSDDADLMARAILGSGSYMLYASHRAAPPAQAFEAAKWLVPNVSGRMDNLRAAILRPQLAHLPAQVARWNARYRVVEAGLRGTPGLRIVERPAAEQFVGSSIQFLLPGWQAEAVEEALRRTAARGVELKWFGAPEPKGFTSTYASWRYAPRQRCPQTDAIMAGLIDMRLPLTFSLADCAQIARIIRAEVAAAQGARA